MPRLNRARIVNVKYDGGKKVYQDQTFDFRGRNGIILLENGGGKTLLVQLILQVIRPNTSLNRRHFSELFSGGQTSHLLLEWSSDGEDPGYILTGLTASLPTDSERLKVFNYIHQYVEPNPFDLERIPVVRDRKVVPLTQFRRHLQGSGRDIRIYDIRRDYYRDLASYNIFTNEWEAIRRANDEEGGTEGFFEGCTDVGRLFRNILIPSILDVLYQDSDRDEIARAFTELREKLVNIPRYREELDELEEARERMESALREVEKYGEIRGQHRRVIEGMQGLYRALEEAIPARKVEMDGIEKERDRLAAESDRLNYERDNLQVQRFQVEIDKLARNRDKVVQSIDRLAEEKQGVERDLNRLRAEGKKMRLEAKEREFRLCMVRLEAAEKEQEDLHRELQRCRFSLRAILPHEIARAKKDLAQRRRCWDDLRVVRTALNEEIAEKNRLRDELQRKRGALDYRIERAKQQARKVEACFGWEAMFEPSNALEKRVGRMEDLDTAIEEGLECIDGLILKIEAIEEAIDRDEREDERVSRDLQDLKQQREDYLREKTDLWTAVLPLLEGDHDPGDLHRLVIAQYLQGQREILGEKQIVRAQEYHRASAALSRLTGDDQYVPNADMLRVMDALLELGVRAVPGGQLVRSQPTGQDEKLAILGGCPLLPYGLCITEDDRKVILRNLDLLEDLFLEAPVPLFSDREALLLKGAGELGLVPIGDPSVYMASNVSFPLHVSETEMGLHKRELEHQVQRAREGMDDATAGIRRLTEVLSQIEIFQGRFTPEHEVNLIGRIGALQNRKEELKGRIEEGRAGVRECRQRRCELKERVQGYRSEREELEEEAAELAAYVDSKAERDTDEHSKRETEDELRALGEEIDRARQKDEQHRETLLQQQRAIDEAQQSLQELEAHLLQLDGEDLGEWDPMEGSYGELCDATEAREQQVAHVGVADMKRLLHELTDSMQQTRGEIIALDFDPEEIPGRESSPSKMAEIEGFIERKREEIERLTGEKRDLESQVDRLEGKVEDRSRRIEQRWGVPTRRLEEDQGAHLDDLERSLIIQLKDVTGRIEDRERQLTDEGETLREHQEVAKALRWLLKRHGAEDCSEADAAGIPADVRGHFEDLEGKERVLGEKMQMQRQVVKDGYAGLSGGRAYRHRVAVQVLTTIEELPDGVLFDPGQLVPRFQEYFLLLTRHREAVEDNLQRLEKDQKDVEAKAFREALRLYGEMNQISRYSRFKLGDRRLPTVRINLGAASETELQNRMSHHVRESIGRLRKMDEEQVAEFIDETFRPAALVDAIAPIEKYRVEILKPERPGESPQYVRWETVPKWSGGEKFTAYFMMLVTLLSYLRDKRVTDYRSSKVIVADNPFGKASSRHLLEMVFGLAEETDTQMLCLTALKERAIYEHFPIVYSLVLSRTQGRSYVEVDRKNSVLPPGRAISSAQYGLFDDRGDVG